MAQALHTADETVVALSLSGLNVGEALSHADVAGAVPSLLGNGMLRHAARNGLPVGGIAVMTRTGDVLVDGLRAGNVLEAFGLPTDRPTLTVDLGVRQPVAASGAVRRALGLGLGEAVAIVRSTRPVTLSRGDLVAVLVEVLAACAERNHGIEAGQLLDTGVATLASVMAPTLA